jgi:hypothetical protein
VERERSRLREEGERREERLREEIRQKEMLLTRQNMILGDWCFLLTKFS